MPILGLGLGLEKYRQLASFASRAKALGAVLYLDARKADGVGPLIGNESPWVDKANEIGINKAGYTSFYPETIVVPGYSIQLKLKPNTQYTLSSDVPIPSNGTTLYLNGTSTPINGVWTGNPKTTTSDSEGKLFVFVPSGREYTNDILNGIYNIMLNEGVTPLPYEPYARNDGKLVNFAGTALDGWNANPPRLTFDGIDSYVQFADSASLDIVNAPLAVFATVFIPIGYNTSFLQSRYNGSTYQYSLYLSNSLDSISIFTNLGSRSSDPNTLVPGMWQNVGWLWRDGNVTFYKDFEPVGTSPLVGLLASVMDDVLGQRAGGGFNTDSDISTHTRYTGANVDIDKILKLEADISKQYLDLNP